jgi:prohibitin 1
MDDSDKGSAGGPTPPAGPQGQPPIGGMVRDPREIKVNPSLVRFLRERLSAAVVSGLVSIGVLRPRNANGELGPRSWKGLFAFLATIFVVVFVWTSIHIVQPGTVAVPVTLGHPGKPLDSGVHLTLPFTTAYSMSTRTQNYTMSSVANQGPKGNTDTAVSVLGQDGGAATVNATVLYRLDPSKATDVFRALGTNYSASIVRPDARSCVRAVFTRYDVVAAATAAWNNVEDNVGKCMKEKFGGTGLLLQDFQLKEVTLDPNIAVSVNAKVAAQQTEEQQKFLLATAVQQADITRIQALATADSQQILACGGVAETIVKDGAQVSTVVPNPLTRCSQSQLTPAYLQFTYIQALKQLVNSPNTTTLILPFDKNLTPLLNVPSGSSSTSGSTGVVTTPSSTGP